MSADVASSSLAEHERKIDVVILCTREAQKRVGGGEIRVIEGQHMPECHIYRRLAIKTGLHEEGHNR